MVILPGEADYSLLKERIIDELCADNRSWRSQCPVGQKTDLPLLIYVVAGRWFDVSYSITFSARSRIGSGIVKPAVFATGIAMVGRTASSKHRLRWAARRP
jgi:hypothetical protein